MDSDLGRVTSPETNLLTVAEKFLRKSWRLLPVLEDGRILGQVSRYDVLRAEHHLATRIRRHVGDSCDDVRQDAEQSNADVKIAIPSTVRDWMDTGARTISEDTDLDILGTRGMGSDANSNFSWARNDGAGNFTVLDNVRSGQGDFLQGVAVDRFGPNGTGPVQIALSWHAGGGGVQMLTVDDNPSSGQWAWERITTSTQHEALSSGDIDNDGDNDLLLGTRWLRNDQTDWTTFTLFATSASPDRNRLVDMNGDGRLDAVVGFEAISTPGKLAWYEQPATSPEDPWIEHEIATIIGPMSVDVADIDSDGDFDVTAGEHDKQNGGASARVFVFENVDGAGTTWKSNLVYTGDEHHDGTQFVDTDRDGDLDIVSIFWTNPHSLVLYENLAISGSGVPPAVDITLGAPSPTGGPTIDFDLVFSEGVLNVDETDFDLDVTGTATGTIASVGDLGDGNPATWTVTVSGVGGEGTLGLVPLAENDIGDLDGLPLELPPNVSEAYTVTDSPLPSINRADPSPTNATTVVFDLVFNEPVFNVTGDAFTLNENGATGSIVSAGGVADAWTLTVDNVTGDGTLGLAIVSGNDIQDASGNGLFATPVVNDAYTIDNTMPTLSIYRADPSPTSADTVTFDLQFGEPVVNVDVSDVMLELRGTVTAGTVVVSDAGDSDASTWAATVDNVDGDGVSV